MPRRIFDQLCILVESLSALAKFRQGDGEVESSIEMSGLNRENLSVGSEGLGVLAALGLIHGQGIKNPRVTGG
jgi:hypothetical protein